MATNTFEALTIIDELHHEYATKMQVAAPTSNFSTLIEFQPVTNTMVDNSDKRGGNILGLEPIVKDGPVLMWLVSLTVDTEANQEVILPIAREFVAAINQKEQAAGHFVDWIYLNYAWKDEKPYSHYGQDNLDLLSAVSRKYDPNGVFQKLRQTGFRFS
jgi:xanthine dehydrogenase iron-sulfur cluster and FAD-binding subunit A